MAAGPITVRDVDYSEQALMAWQTLKGPIGTAETALTAAKLGQNMRDVSADEDTVEVIPVEMFKMIRVMLLATGSANQSPVLNLYGWSETGPGHHIGTLTTDLGSNSSAASTGFHAQPKTHRSIRDEFAAASTWLIADQFVITADYESEHYQAVEDPGGTPIVHVSVGFKSIRVPAAALTATSGAGGTIGTATAEANFPQYFNVDFSMSRYKYFGLLPTNLDSATAVGAIFKPICLR